MQKSYGFLVLAMLSWGLANPLSDLALETLPVGQMFLIEIGAGLIALTVFFNRKWMSLPWKYVLILGLLQPGLTYFFGNLGYASGTVSTGLIIMSAEVLLLAIFGWFFLHEKLNSLEAIALLIGFAGVILAGFSVETGDAANPWASGFFALAAVAAAGYAVIVRRLATSLDHLDAVGLAWGQALISFAFALLSYPVSISLEPAAWSFALPAIAAAVGSGIFGVALPFIWYAKAAVQVPTGHAAIGLNLIPIFGILIGAIIGRGIPTTSQMFGGGLVFLSVLVLQKRQSTEN